MKLNNPMLFNGQLLATYQSLFEKLGIASDLSGSNLVGFITSSLIDNSSLGKVTVAELNYETGKTVATKLAELSGEIQTQLDALKTYEVTAAADTAIVVNPTLTDAKDSFEVSLKLAGDMLSQSADGLTVIPSAVVHNSGLSLTKVTPAGEDAAQFVSAYELQLNGAKIGDTINIPKDQFLKQGVYVPATEELVLTFEYADGTTGDVRIPVGALVDEYSAGAGIELTDSIDGKNVISVKIAGNYLSTAIDGNLEVVNVATENLVADGIRLATEGAVIDYVSGVATEIVTDLTETIDLTSSALVTKITELEGEVVSGAYAAVKYVDTLPLPGAELETAALINTLYVDAEGQTCIVRAGETSGIDISQEFVDSASAIQTGATELVTAGAVADYVAAKATELTVDYNTKFAEVSGVIENLTTELGGNLTDAIAALSGEFKTAEAKLGADIGIVSAAVEAHYSELTDKTADISSELSAASGALAADIAALSAVTKFVKVTDIDAVPDVVADTLYYTAEGQAKIYGADGWQSLSMEAVTEITSGTVSDQTTATSLAIKTYVDTAMETAMEAAGDGISVVSGAVDAVAADLTTTRAQAAQIYEEEIEFGSAADATVTGRVIAIYDGEGEQCYPSIKYAAGVSTIGLDEPGIAVSAYTVVYAAALAPIVKA